MKKLFTLVLVLAALWGQAQTNDSAFRFRTALTLNPLVLVNTDLTAMIGVEHRLPHRLALVLDAGYIFDTYFLQNTTLKGAQGFTLRPGLKWYNSHEKGFLQFQVAYKQVDYKMEDWLGKACVNGTPAYEKFQEFIYRKKTLSFNALAGELFRLSNAVFVEVYGGVGVKVKTQRPTEPGTCYQGGELRSGFNTYRAHFVTANVPIGVKLVVALKK